MKRHLSLVIVAISAACGGSRSVGTTPAAGAPAVGARAAQLYREALVIDTHNDMPTRMLDDAYNADVRHPAGVGRGRGHTDLPRLVESGLSAQFLSAWVDAPYARRRGASYARAIKYVDAIQAFVERHPDRLRFSTTTADIRTAKREGRVAIFIGLEGGHAIEGSLEGLRELYARGVRYMTLTWNNGNEWAGSSVGVDGTRTGGLTAFGRDVIREMNRIGMLVDLSHVSDSTFADALAVTTAPVLVSHSSARALNDVPRNLTDAQLRAVARNGGVVNINFYSRFLDPEFRARMDEVERALAAERAGARNTTAGDSIALRRRVAARRDSLIAGIPPVPFSRLIDHFDHVARVAGVDHVGIGSDFDGVSALPEGMEDVTRLPRIAQALIDRGYSERDVTKMLGGNMMRLMARVLDPK